MSLLNSKLAGVASTLPCKMCSCAVIQLEDKLHAAQISAEAEVNDDMTLLQNI